MEEEEIAAEPSAEEVTDARGGQESQLSSLPEGLFAKVMACGDRLVMLAPKLITNQISDLAEYYMSIRCYFDGGKQYNRIQRGSFEARCYAAGLRVQSGTKWVAELWEKSTGEKPGEVYIFITQEAECLCINFTFHQVFQAAVNRQQKTVEKDCARKASSSYQKKRKSARYSSTSGTVQHHYGPHCQQPDPPKEELLTLCQEYYEREVVVTQRKAADIEANTWSGRMQFVVSP